MTMHGSERLQSYIEARRLLVDPKASEDDETLDRDRSARTVAYRTALFEVEGWHDEEWVPGPGQPGVTCLNGYWSFGSLSAGWLDHPYTLLSSTGERWFVSEPYEISEEGLHNLATLSASGLWDVWIRGDRALHFPGRTVAIYLRLSES